MSYRFIFGASGAGKSYHMHKEVIRRARAALDHFCTAQKSEAANFLVIVPEQFTLLTQKELAGADPGGVIMNVDVLSFARLAHRIFEEVSAQTRVLLDDTGKNLILRKLASELKEELPLLGRAMHRQGMTGEVKSTISELMQYDISPDRLEEICEQAKQAGQGALGARLADIISLYRAFEKFKEDRFITGEDRMTLLAEAIPASELIRNSVIYFDGFTGFTPLQEKVIEALMTTAKELVFTVLYSDDGGPHPAEPGPDAQKEDRLFFLSRKMCDNIRMMAAGTGIAHSEDLVIDEKIPRRFVSSPELAHLEKNIFRHGSRRFDGASGGSLMLMSAASPEEETRLLCADILTAVMNEGYAFHDFAVIASDPEIYTPFLQRMGKAYGLPFYIDRTAPMSKHPLSRAALYALDTVSSGFSFNQMFNYLRSGLSALAPEDVDVLENYCLAHGVYSRKKWDLPFDDVTEPLRKKVLEELEPLLDPGSTVADRISALRTFLEGISAADRLAEMAEEFLADGDRVREIIYSQVFESFTELLDQAEGILGEEEISVRDFRDLIEAGLSEIRLGTLPQNADSIVVGDLERTRLPEVKVLCLLGCNDGLIPRGSAAAGILSEHDRTFLKEAGIELSPDARASIFQQKTYLYMNLTRPSEKLWIYYSSSSQDGTTQKPSFLIGHLMELFPDLQVRTPGAAGDTAESLISARKDAVAVYAGKLREYAEAREEAEVSAEAEASGSADAGVTPDPALLTLHGLLLSDRESADTARRVFDAAFLYYFPGKLSEECADTLYGKSITGSVTRLESMSECALKQYLKYGLGLKERDVYKYESTDAGTILHMSVDLFDAKLRERGLSWLTISSEEQQALMEEVFNETAAGYHDLLMYGTSRTSGLARRYLRILYRTADALQYQIKKGSFIPAGTEVVFGSFDPGTDPDNAFESLPGSGRSSKTNLSFGLRNGKKMTLTGRVDRYDLCVDGDSEYIKIMDYKSGDRDLKEDLIRQGLNIQLPVYMMAVMKSLENQADGKRIVPAAMLYYRFKDPLTDADKESETLYKKLRPKGLVNKDSKVLSLLDHTLDPNAGEQRKSDVIPAELKKDGAPAARSDVFDNDSFDAMIRDVKDVICEKAADILDGSISCIPVKYDQKRSACTYCPFAQSCGFDLKLPGYHRKDTGE